MKTMDDLRNQYLNIIETVIANDHAIMDGTATENTAIFDQDGWYAEICYECTGIFADSSEDWWTPGDCDLISAKGEVTGIEAISYIDPVTGEETDFEGEQLDEIKALINKELERIY